MNTINAKCGEVNYPIGINMAHNLPVIQGLAKTFKKEYKSKKKINVFCMGSSGAIMAAIFASIVKNVTVIHIKKDGEKSHSEYTDYSRFIGEDTTNIIIDDFIGSGDTMRMIYKKIVPKVEIDYLILGYCYNVERKMNILDFTPKNVIYSYN